SFMLLGLALSTVPIITTLRRVGGLGGLVGLVVGLLVIGLLVGGLVGLLFVGLLVAGRQADERQGQAGRDERERAGHGGFGATSARNGAVCDRFGHVSGPIGHDAS